MAATTASRREFIDSSIQFLREKEFDGLDLDWKIGKCGTDSDYENFATLLQVCATVTFFAFWEIRYTFFEWFVMVCVILKQLQLDVNIVLDMF